MNTRTLAIAAIALWAATAATGAFLFVRGQTTLASDGRTAVLLDSGERDLVLMEMRTLLTSVQGIVSGLARDQRADVRKAAAGGGMAIAQEVPPGLMAKLPLEFKQLGMEVHRDFDAIAAGIDQGETTDMTLARLEEQLGRCVGCHAAYRLAVPEANGGN
jgi:hypothetical protein